MNAQTVSLLLVEDDEIDVETMKRSLRKQKIANPVFTASNGLDALNMLRGKSTGETKEIPKPYIVLLDLNMPRMNGIEFLEELRKDEELHKTIVFVLTTSDDDRDKSAAYDKNIAGYLVKSKVGVGFVEAVNLLDNYWKVAECPPEVN